jgi:type IV secretion system protein VirB10
MNSRVQIEGERTVARALESRPVAMRLQRILAAALMLAVGAALLAWYYLHLGRAGQESAAGVTGLHSAVRTEMRLPALEPSRAPTRAPDAPGAEGTTRTVVDEVAAQGRAAPPAAARATGRANWRSVDAPQTSVREPAPVLLRAPATSAAPADALARVAPQPALGAQDAPSAAAGANLGDVLQPTVAKPTEAGMLPTRRWLLPKGSFLDCTLETAIDSTFAGQTTCVLATDAFGADGRVVLLERGTKLIGETRSEARAGQARVTVLWNEARTPTGVVLNLVSPGTDALGRAGVPGIVDRHSAERFAAAVLLSVLDAAIGDFAARRQGSGAIVYNAQGTRDVATEVLRNTIAIPPTISVPAGSRVAVAVVRDVDFRAVYSLVAHAGR